MILLKYIWGKIWFKKKTKFYCALSLLLSLSAQANDTNQTIIHDPLLFAKAQKSKTSEPGTLCESSKFYASKKHIQHCGNNPVKLNDKNLGDYGNTWKLRNPSSIFWEQQLENLGDKLVVELIDKRTGKPWPTKSYARKFDSKYILEIKPSKKIRRKNFYLTAHLLNTDGTKKASWIKKLYIN